MPKERRMPSKEARHWGHSSVGRAPALQAGGHRFDPVCLHQFYNLQIQAIWYFELFMVSDGFNLRNNASIFNKLESRNQQTKTMFN